ncbi:MAG: efflux RND transporter periplasmic adaptor subunit [Holophaga sp.]|nr:efflux RND transporter periplasmic adaptor subunit [Holophaga sp.]
MTTRKTKILIGAGSALVLLIILGTVFGGGRDESDAYSWDRITKGDIRETITASGEIQARTKISIGTSVMGEIKALHVKDGQDVKAGQPLVTIDQERLKQGLIQATAALEGVRQDSGRMKAAKTRAEENFTRMESLYKQGLISDEEYRQARLNRDTSALSFQSSEASIHQSQANLASMKDSLSKSELRAPISGRVTGLKALKGETAIPGQSNLPGAMLMVISDMSEIIAEIKVNESEVVRTRIGQTAQVMVESFPGRVFPGKVYEVATASEKIGQDANMYLVKVALEMTSADVASLRPGMSARAIVLTNEAKGVLRVPLQSVLEREGTMEDAQKKGLLSPEGRNVAFVVKDGRATERTVKTGIANTQFIEVKDGLQENEQVLTGPVRKLKEMKEKATVKVRAKSDQELEEEAKKRKGQKS